MTWKKRGGVVLICAATTQETTGDEDEEEEGAGALGAGDAMRSIEDDDASDDGRWRSMGSMVVGRRGGGSRTDGVTGHTTQPNKMLSIFSLLAKARQAVFF